ncbi:MAG: RluA family pseudouridine synthase [Clostridia bacterium]|nr:RluA family pseudouridine synthase [Clostridia bacterium]
MDILIDNNYEGKLIREVLKKDLGYSVNLIKKLKFAENGILVNGQWVTVRYELKHGDVLSLAVEDKPEDVSPYIIPVPLDLPVIYEDEWVTAVNKPCNMPSHPSLGHQLDTVANALAYRYSYKTYVFRPVNRLDRDTSGCMLTSNTRDASFKMYTAMVEGRIHKTYLAVLDGIPEKREGFIDSFMHRRADSIIEREECAPDAPDAKRALSAYRVLCDNGVQCIAAASPITGRTHQLRVHFAGIGCPVTGDTLYGSGSPHIQRHALHSWKTVFPHPMTGETVTAEASMPEDIEYLTEMLGLQLPEDAPSDLSNFWNQKDI